MGSTRGRLHGIVLVPLLLGLFGGDAPGPERREQGTVELSFPEGRRRPPPGGAVPATTSAVVPSATTTTSGGAEPERSTQSMAGRLAGFSGRVVDEVTGSPVTGARVSLPELDLHAVTDADGRFELQGVEPREGSYEVLVSRSTYKSLFADETFRAGERVLRTLRLRPLGW